jgi:SAM-dependent methyltransferase
VAQDPLMAAAVRLSVSLDALAALAAHVRVETEELDADPAVRELLAQVAEEVVGDRVVDRDGPARSVVGLTRAFLRQADDLVAEPGRGGAWDQVDEALLQGLGRLSMAIAGAFVAAEAHLDGLGRRLRRSGGRVLDVGTGTGWLAVALARTYPEAAVVGSDIFEPALALARTNVVAEGLTERIELRLEDVGAMTEEASYDAIWLPLPFLRLEVVPGALEACLRALEPGGWLLAGTFAGTGDRLSELLIDLRTVRSGGHPWRSDELIQALLANDFVEVVEVPRSWPAPVRLYAGRRPSG